VVTGSTADLAQQLRLDRAARTAGEAFAFVDSDEAATATTRSSRSYGGILWLFVSLAAATALYFGF
jgi:hypothetical protein